jgi:GT2 family glycosyltransferase
MRDILDELLDRKPADRKKSQRPKRGLVKFLQEEIRTDAGLFSFEGHEPLRFLVELIERLIIEKRCDSRVAVVGPRLVDDHGRAELSFGRMIGPLNELRQKRLAKSAAVEALTRERQSPDWVSGACLLVRRSDAEAVGGLDERYFMYTEDVDFCAAIRARGRRILFVPEVEIVHLRGRSAASAPAATREHYRRSQQAFYEIHHPGWAPLLKLYVRIFG